MSRGFTLIELLVTVGIFILMTTLLVARYGSFNDGTILTSTAYDVALELRDAQSYGLNVEGFDSTNSFNYPYGIDFNLSHPQQFILFADSYAPGPSGSYGDGLCTDGTGSSPCVATQQGPGSGDGIVTAYALKNGAFISGLCVGSGPSSCNPVLKSLDITYKRPDPNAIIKADGNSATTYSYAEIQVEDGGKTSTRTIVVRQIGEIAVENQ